MMKNFMGLMFLIPLIFKNFLLVLVSFFFFFLSFLMKINIMSFYCSVSYYFGIDLLSFLMILLSFWIWSLMILATTSLYISNYYWELFLLTISMLLLSLIFAFSSMDLFIFIYFLSLG